MRSLVRIKDIGEQLDGHPVLEILLSNAHAAITLFSFGATLQKFEIEVPDYHKRDIVLGYKDCDAYQRTFEKTPNAYFGAIVGPIAGRITNAKIPFKDDFYQFQANEGPHLLHGGKRSFSNVNWKLLSYKENPYPQVTFFLETKAYSIEHPGNLRCEVSYTLQDFALEIKMESIALEDTLANPTQHTYFNPNGHQGSVLDTEAWIAADSYVELNKEKLPTGRMLPLNADHSFPSTTYLGYPLHSTFEGLDHSFILNAKKQQAQLIAADRFELRFDTNQPVLQVYVGGETNIPGKNEIKYHRYSGICLEQQAEPDAPNHENFSDIYLLKGQSKTNHILINFEQHK
jgi:aldose 1-epimerase